MSAEVSSSSSAVPPTAPDPAPASPGPRPGVSIEVNLGNPFHGASERAKKNAAKIHSVAAVEQVVKLFEKYDTEHAGSISVSALPAMASDLGVKPWRAMKELAPGGSKSAHVSLPQFLTWWFSNPLERTREEENYANHIFTKYADVGDGTLISHSSMVRLCLEIGVKPWFAFRELELDEEGRTTLGAFLTWWFSDNSSAPHRTPRKTQASKSPRPTPRAARHRVAGSPSSKPSVVALRSQGHLASMACRAAMLNIDLLRGVLAGEAQPPPELSMLLERCRSLLADANV